MVEPKSPFGPCKAPQLLLADEKKAFLSRPAIAITGPDIKIYSLQNQGTTLQGIQPTIKALSGKKWSF